MDQRVAMAKQQHPDIEMPLLNFTNYTDHPTERNIMVFMFKTKEAGQHFEEGLTQRNIWFVKDESGSPKHPKMVMFAVKKGDAVEAMNQNYLTTAATRKPFMPDVLFRYTVLIITIFLVTLAIIGYVKYS